MFVDVDASKKYFCHIARILQNLCLLQLTMAVIINVHSFKDVPLVWFGLLPIYVTYRFAYI